MLPIPDNSGSRKLQYGLREQMSDHYDTIIVGGGPAGLSAALVLGRCLRRVLLCDSGRYRNERSRAVNCFLSRDGIPPAQLLECAREQLRRYDSIGRMHARVFCSIHKIPACKRFDLGDTGLIAGFNPIGAWVPNERVRTLADGFLHRALLIPRSGRLLHNAANRYTAPKYHQGGGDAEVEEI